MQFEKTGCLFVVMSVCHVEQLGFNQASFHEILYWVGGGDIFTTVSHHGLLLIKIKQK